ncbi:cytochrome c [Hymenobacter sp. 5317J-9]|uniref:c-type cytochrome n=1 Tax=Hymenobacter sp. 5317J-9 TaxID=2932250 RepID=UPI001FD6370B|nr:cytochrome c [Hymenobacter sp. 5317J-9]UOQ99665.1 cytochrome c [Hymenobacter sp. 5317J-9]
MRPALARPASALGAALALLAALLQQSCFSNNRHQGEKLYAQHCAGCHGEQGQGLGRLIPPLAGADYLVDHRAELPCLLRQGQNEVIVVNGVGYHNVMPGNKALSPAQLTNLLNFIETHWGNSASPRTIREVEQQLEACRAQ